MRMTLLQRRDWSSLTIDSLPNEIYDRIALFLPAFKFRKLQTVSRRWRFCTTFSFAVRYVLIHQNHLSVDFSTYTSASQSSMLH
ncbi:hypothetical protein BC829DRAFT_178291 [Chytridium lagenaria]|nr:hypothetical protein BC829DRAFT_178291 [Chytridium lagenaria]